MILKNLKKIQVLNSPSFAQNSLTVPASVILDTRMRPTCWEMLVKHGAK